MSRRPPKYMFVIWAMAVLTSAGQIVFGFLFCIEGYRTRRWPLAPVPGLSRPMHYGSRLRNSDFWKDRLIFLKYGMLSASMPGQMEWHYDWFDPETGLLTPADFTTLGASPFLPVVYGDRLYFNSGTYWAELADGKRQPSVDIAAPIALSNGNHVLLDGERAMVGIAPAGIVILKLIGTTWESDSLVTLPSRDRNWIIDGTPVNFGFVRRILILNDAERVHMFVDVGGPILHRAGLDRRLISAADRTGPLPAAPRLVDEPVSALLVENFETATEGWSLVTSQSSPAGNQPSLLGILVGGQPALVLVNQTSEASTSGLIRRFDGAKWTDFAMVDFPFASGQPQVYSSWDGQRAYLFVSTPLGLPYGYRIDASGVRPLRMDALRWTENPLLNGLRGYAAIIALTTFLGIIFGGIAWLGMRKWTTGTYQFGTQAVALASLGRRGIARLIDLLIVGGTTALLIAALSWRQDWRSLAEALNLRVPHPTVTLFLWGASVAAAWLVGLQVVLILSQARWGVTPGKWCCGIRTLRATLKPCGVARSLVREVVICVDTCNTLCWAPGILSIALTDRRQRLGDLVADTIVVEARSMGRPIGST